MAARGRACIYQVLSARAWKNYRAIRRAVSLDVTDPEQTLAVIQAEQPTHVMHLAGISVVSQANQDVRKTWDVNTQGTLNVALGIKQGVPTYRLLFCSSAQVYGGNFGTGEPLGEDGCARHGQRRSAPRPPAPSGAGQYPIFRRSLSYPSISSLQQEHCVYLLAADARASALAHAKLQIIPDVHRMLELSELG